MSDFFEIVRQVLIPMFYKETQLGRSIRKSRPEFKKKLFEATLELADKADNGILRNEDIQKKITALSNTTNVSIGQAQKVINVFLKYYCILTQKPDAIISELDCPLDSQIMSRFKTKGIKRTSLKKMTKIEDYIAWQNHLKKVGKGIRLRPDIQTYDKERIRLFFSS